ncbi:MAG: TonB-dependent receptor [Pseudomonadales bacterium]|nr:TonB-dependent receptor [Pseudomonadales bacterium]
MNTLFRLKLATFLIASAVSATAAENADEAFLVEEVVVIGTKDKALNLPGSGTLIEDQELERFDHVDINQVLARVPGLYVREEDGYGLRPNIGIRGASAERSQKITIMEDGVLIAPAPYSAPAAYYFPNVSRVAAVEVLKGPSSIRHGPHTVGGAVNFVSSQIDTAPAAEIDLSAGTDGFYKVQGLWSRMRETNGLLIDLLQYGSKGFKNLDGGGDTGFERSDLNVKLRFRPNTRLRQSLTVKLGYGDEVSDETYLGLTDTDFSSDPNRRYRASQLGQFRSKHKKVHLNHTLEIQEDLLMNAKAYVNRFDRDWNKLDGFINGPTLQSVLRYPQQFVREYDLLRGNIDSAEVDGDRLDITNNQREFDSMGAQLSLNWAYAGQRLDHETSLGVRFHKDQVDRHHKQRGYLMTSGDLLWDDVVRAPKLRNRAETDAVSAWLTDTMKRNDWSLTAGVRVEDIKGVALDFETGAVRANEQSIVSPGVGGFWQITKNFSTLFGVYRGFSPAGPGDGGVEPEESINYEYGVRLQTSLGHLEVVGFFSDYQNLVGRCRVSDSDCQPGDEYNGGEVEIAGVEITGGVSVSLRDQFELATNLTYTYTESAFQTTFLSEFSQWGLVQKGDALPYLPQHVAQIEASLATGRWDIIAAIKFQDEMREVPGYGRIGDELGTDGHKTLKLAATWYQSEKILLQIIAQNILNEAAIVSHRPFGARPNRPRSIVARIKLTL